jgi:D-glycero-D-manno-heptose 1,7-bisphosphate phosphatase
VTTRRPAVFLDRDGVLNASDVVNGEPRPPGTSAELVLLPGVAEACAQLKDAGFVLVVVTNQPDIARGSATPADVDAVNARLQTWLPLDEIVVCGHDDIDGCDCRKPQPGMVLSAARRLGLDLSRSVMVGDRWRDVEAGRRAGVSTVFIDRGYRERRPDAPDAIVAELIDAVPFILARLQTEEVQA